jgi:CRISPR/Cas system endoribonuclease Cas6 (RAMP superfamily)
MRKINVDRMRRNLHRAYPDVYIWLIDKDIMLDSNVNLIELMLTDYNRHMHDKYGPHIRTWSEVSDQIDYHQYKVTAGVEIGTKPRTSRASSKVLPRRTIRSRVLPRSRPYYV